MARGPFAQILHRWQCDRGGLSPLEATDALHDPGLEGADPGVNSGDVLSAAADAERDDADLVPEAALLAD